MSDHAMFRQRVRGEDTEVSYACIKAAINTGRVVDVDGQGRIGGDATDRDTAKVTATNVTDPETGREYKTISVVVNYRTHQVVTIIVPSE